MIFLDPLECWQSQCRVAYASVGPDLVLRCRKLALAPVVVRLLHLSQDRSAQVWGPTWSACRATRPARGLRRTNTGHRYRHPCRRRRHVVAQRPRRAAHRRAHECHWRRRAACNRSANSAVQQRGALLGGTRAVRPWSSAPAPDLDLMEAASPPACARREMR